MIKKFFIIIFTVGFFIGCGGGDSGKIENNDDNYQNYQNINNKQNQQNSSSDDDLGNENSYNNSNYNNNGQNSDQNQQDTTPPVITISGSDNITIKACDNFTPPKVTAKDDIDGDVKVTLLDSFDTFDSCKLGKYSFTYKAMDSNGNTATKKLLVNVVGLQLTLIGGNSVTVYQYSDDYNDTGYTAKSSYDSSVTVDRNGSVDTDTLGNYVLTYVATDGKGHTKTVKRTVKVIENPNIEIHRASTVAEFRKALEESSANGKEDVILLSSGIYKTTADNQGTFDFNDNEPYKLRIYGEANGTILDGNHTNSVLDFDNNSNGDIILKHLTIQNGANSGIHSKEYLVLDDCKIHDNIGHGIYAEVGTKISNCKIYNNIHVGKSDYYGGGIYSLGKTDVFSSKIYNNVTESYGGGIYSKKDLTIYDSEVYGNTLRNKSSLYSSGGGIYVDFNYGDTLSNIYNTKIYNNNVMYGDGGGIYISSDNLFISNSKIYNNNAGDQYGGIYANSLYISNSEVKDNNATEQGGIYVDNEIYMRDSNVTGNLSTDAEAGGGIYIGVYGFHKNSLIVSSNISNNRIINKNKYNYNHDIRGVGIYANEPKSLFVANCIIANNTAEHLQGGDAYGIAVHVSDDRIPLNMYNNTIVNNVSIGATNTYGAIYGHGMFYNNIIDKNEGTIDFRGDSQLYNNYVDYTSLLNETTYTIIKKNNILPQVGVATYNSDFTLSADSILVDKGTTPSTSWWGDDYYDDMKFYNFIIENLKKDISGNLRNDGAVDIGAYEYQQN